MDLVGDDETEVRRNLQKTKWDRKKKKFVSVQSTLDQSKKIKTESGGYIKASYKSDLYAKWLKRNKSAPEERDDDDDEDGNSRKKNKKFFGSSSLGKFVCSSFDNWSFRTKVDCLTSLVLVSSRKELLWQPQVQVRWSTRCQEVLQE